MSAIQLVVGLGNPGIQYQGTRHNLGLTFTEQLCVSYQSALQLTAKLSVRFAKIIDDDLVFWIAIPTTFMNQSGLAVSKFIKFYRIPLNQVLIVHDELDLPAGIARFKQGGGTGGHNGLKDIISACGGSDFWRLRLGIGHPGKRHQVHHYVLSTPSNEEALDIQKAMKQAQHVLAAFIQGNYDSALHTLHSQ